MVVLVYKNDIYITHVGDSRVYLFKEDKLERLTEDHNVANKYVQLGIITKEEARNHPTQSVLSNSVGMMNETEDRIKITTLKPENGMRILMCTDGLTGMLSESDIENVLMIELNAETAVNLLIKGANTAGGTDNITAVLIDIGQIS